MDFGVEDGKPQTVAGEPVAVLAGDAGDERVGAQPGQVVAGLVHRVGGTAEQSGHQGAQALVGDAGDGVVHKAPARAWTRGSPNRKAGALLPSSVRVGRAIRSKAGLARTQPWPTRSVSSRVVLTARARACSSSGWTRRRRHPRSSVSLTTVSTRSARPSFRYCLIRECR